MTKLFEVVSWINYGNDDKGEDESPRPEIKPGDICTVDDDYDDEKDSGYTRILTTIQKHAEEVRDLLLASGEFQAVNLHEVNLEERLKQEISTAAKTDCETLVKMGVPLALAESMVERLEETVQETKDFISGDLVEILYDNTGKVLKVVRKSSPAVS